MLLATATMLQKLTQSFLVMVKLFFIVEYFLQNIMRRRVDLSLSTFLKYFDVDIFRTAECLAA